jgi:hypothetical protein
MTFSWRSSIWGEGVQVKPAAYGAQPLVGFGWLRFERCFRRFACPPGALPRLAGKIELTKVTRTDEGCKGGNLRQAECFAHIEFVPTNPIREWLRTHTKNMGDIRRAVSNGCPIRMRNAEMSNLRSSANFAQREVPQT